MARWAPTLGLFLLHLPQLCLAFKFYSQPGFALARRILLEVLPTFEPHHYQIDGVCKVLDGVDLVAVTPTGSGKTGYLFLSILVMIALANTPSLCPAIKFCADPTIVVICPTNSIEQQMEENMGKLGLAALMINSDTVAAARVRGEDLWAKVCAGISMVILGPEQLISKGFRDFLAHEPFYNRVCALGVDKIHLLIGFMCSRFRPGIPIIGLTATLLADLKLHSGIDGRSFPEIAWVLKNTDKTLIFCLTISLGFRVKAYLNSILSHYSNRDFRIRTHTGINWPDDKLQTLVDIASSPACQIIITTNSLAQGNGICVIKTVIQLGELESVEMYV
ncbi:P-loop containing nucleoside triphosphate hydrolase protein [Mycena filopes]|nr:P-loop containing nucleoside triphosphate hydrolase protein [Mycena filopes]